MFSQNRTGFPSFCNLSGVIFARYFAYSSSMDRLAGLAEETRKLALDRFHLLQPHLEENHPLRLVAAAAGMPFRTVQ